MVYAVYSNYNDSFYILVCMMQTFPENLHTIKASFFSFPFKLTNPSDWQILTLVYCKNQNLMKGYIMHLLINFILALLLDSAGFVMYVYFFSIGYGLSVAGLAAAMLFMFRYLLIRELKNANYKKLLKSESKSNVPVGVKFCIWIACALLFLGQTSPVLFRMEAGKGFDIFSVIGIVLMATGILLEIGADWQKNEAKKKDAHMFVSTGLYSFVRCPNYLGELLLWTGVFISGLNVYHTALEWAVALLGYIGIIYVMFSGARRLEIRQDKNYGHMPAYQNYVKTTPILLPFVPIYSVKKHTWLVA